jgi:hypothetical protein
MAFSADSFKKAVGSPIKPPPAPGGMPGAGGGMDMDALMKPPGSIEDMPEDVEGPGGEMGETSLEQALEGAGIVATPEQINEIKGILGLSGGMAPDAGAEPPMGGAPAKPAFSSKLDKMLGK